MALIIALAIGCAILAALVGVGSVLRTVTLVPALIDMVAGAALAVYGVYLSPCAAAGRNELARPPLGPDAKP